MKKCSNSKIRMAVISVLVLFETGCATFLAPYVPPSASAKDTARLRILEDMPSPRTTLLELSKKCIGGDFIGSEWAREIGVLGTDIQTPNRRVQSIGMPYPPPVPDMYTEIRIPAGKEFAVGFHQQRSIQNNLFVTTTASCSLGIAFTPEEGGEYEAIINSWMGTCRMRLTRFVPKDGDFDRVSVAIRPVTEKCP